MKEGVIPSHPEWYQSQKGFFAGALREQMQANPNIWLVTGDLGFGMLDRIRDEFPRQYLNVGAAEQSMVGVAIGLALEGKIPFVYSIPTFLVYRPFEWIRNYVDHERIPVKLISGGQGKDYLEDGYSHQAEDMKTVLRSFPNIEQFWVEDKTEVPGLVEKLVYNGKPSFMSLSRKA